MEPKYQMNIIEFGKLVRTIGDEDRDRFLKNATEMIASHIDKHAIKDGIVKNLKIELFTNH